MDYKNTIITPKTDFPMKAGLPTREPGMLSRWEEQDLYEAMLEKNKDLPPFVLHDGPPFSNGDIHMGHALNKTLKDFIVRSHAMMGYYTPYVPGWDNHGLPIETAIIKKSKLNHKAMPVPQFRAACEEFAETYIQRQMAGFKRLGVVGNWKHPYRTMDKHFEAQEVKVFGRMFDKGYIYKGLKPVYWCPVCATAVAEAEIEYHDDPCTSVYVKFPMKDDLGKLAGFDLSRTYFVIWTTTIWTLPGNLAICLHPRETYVLVKADNGETYIMAEALMDKVMHIGGFEHYEVIASYPGQFFENMLAQHPFLDKTSRLVNAEYVTMDSGTGCVHTAPGFGADDYQTCMRYGMDLVVPVDDYGRHTDYAGKYAGMKTEESNPVILADMKESGALFASEEIVHSYPHHDRCKKPIIFRATPQWFCSVESFKDEAIAACKDVKWLPAWGGERMISMIRERADWCISRQRRWGVPIPILYCEDCGKVIVNDKTIKAISDMFRKESSDSWYSKDPSEFIPADVKCECGCGKFRKEMDIFDVWFDSGCTHAAVLQERPELSWPADLYLEGCDQYRGWFQSSLLTSVATTGKAPYKAVCTHGWVVDGKGEVMHKSKGNVVLPEEVISKYGADVLRLWVASLDFHNDVRVSPEMLKQLSEAYRKIRNTARFILGNLGNGSGFDPDTEMVALDKLSDIDKWALTRLDAVIEKVKASYESFDFYLAYHAIHSFCVVDMSNFYLDVVKDTLYCSAEKSEERKAVQTTMYIILDSLVKLIAPILTFTSDEIWKYMPHKSTDDLRGVPFNQMPEKTGVVLGAEFEAKWNKIHAVRDDVLKALEEKRSAGVIGKPIDADVTLYADEANYKELSAYPELAQAFSVSNVTVKNGADGEYKGSADGVSVTVEKSASEMCERCWSHDKSVGSDEKFPHLCARCAAVMKLDLG